MSEGSNPEPSRPHLSLPPVPDSNVLRRSWRLVRDSKDAQTTLIIIGIVPVAWLVVTGIVFPVAIFLATQSSWILDVATQKWAILIIGLLGIISIAMSTIVVAQYAKNKKRYWDIEGNKEFTLLQYIVACEVSSPTRIKYRYRYAGKARVDGASKIVHRYIWSGAGDISIQILTPGVSYNERQMEAANRNIIELVFDIPLKKGKMAVVDFVISTIGSMKEQTPTLSKIMDTTNWPKIDTHIFVHFSDKVNISTVLKETYVSWFADQPFERDHVTLGNDRTVHWRVARRLGRRYCVRWAYERLVADG